MNMQIEKYRDNCNNTIKYIEETLTLKNNLGKLINFIINTEINLYGLFEEDYFCALKINPFVMSDLIKTIEHALYDDGEMSLIATDHETKIIFKDSYDIQKENIFSEHLLYVSKKLNKQVPQYRILNVDEFIETSNELYIKRLKLLFLNEAKINLSDAIKHYNKYEVFDKEWLDEL